MISESHKLFDWTCTVLIDCVYVYMLTGLVPIMIGRPAVDPITGELSPIIGVRTNPETDTVVPVTQSSGAHRKRKPPLGSVTILEDEIVARRSFWRRQRQREGDLTYDEFVLAQKVLYDIDSVQPKKVQDMIERMSEKAHALDEAAKRETQRRSEAEQEFGMVLPPDVIAILTEGDEEERKAEDNHLGAHKKYADTITKFFQKLQTEEERFKEKLEDLEDALNPDAEHVVRQRYATIRTRLCAEFKDHILTKMEGLDEEHSTLEYARQRNELLTLEAKALLTGAITIAGDYDCTLPGVYGEGDLASSSANQELIPLLKQLIALLESGQPFSLTSDLLNVIQGGDINIYGGQMTQMTQQPAPQQPVKPTTVKAASTEPQTPRVVQTQLVQRSAADADISTQANLTALMDIDKLKSKPQNDQEHKERMRDLLTKQTYEAAKLENDLRNDEITNVNDILNDSNAKKEQVIADLTTDMKSQLEKAKTDAEREKIMMEHAQNLQKLTDALEKQKQQQMADMREKLLNRRRQRKKDLHRQHISEAKSLGLPPDGVPDMTIGSHDELDADMRRLAQEQEKLLAQLQKATAEEEAKEPAGWDEEMESRIRALHLGGGKEQEIIDIMKNKFEASRNKTQSMRDRLKARKNRSRQREVKGMDKLSEEEKKTVMATSEMQQEADRTKEDNAVLASLKALEQVRHFTL